MSYVIFHAIHLKDNTPVESGRRTWGEPGARCKEAMTAVDLIIL
jgi:hypothetical protein